MKKDEPLKKSICSYTLRLTASILSGYCSEGADRDRSMSGDSAGLRFRPSRRMYSQQSTQDQDTGLPWIAETVTTEMTEVEINPEVTTIIHSTDIEEVVETNNNVPQEEGFLGVPSSASISTSGSADTLVPSAPTSPSNLSNVTLVGSTGSGGDKADENFGTETTISTTTATTAMPFKYGNAPSGPLPERVIPKRPPRTIEQQAASIYSESTTTISQSQQLPQVTTTLASKPPISETRPSIIKIAPPQSSQSTVSALSTNIVTISTSTLLSSSASASASSTTTKTSIATPSIIGVSFDR